MAEYLFHLTPLTPLHIGSGEMLEPFEYVLSGTSLYRFTMENFILALDKAEQARFVEVVGQSIPATRNFVAEKATTAQQVARWQAEVTGAASDLYYRRMTSGEGHPEIRAASRTGDRLYLPASSLKGALRTALLYQHMDKQQQARDARYLEQTVFNFRRVQEDPFRAFKLGDGQPLNATAKIRAVAVNTLRRGRWEQDVPLLVETIPGILSDNIEETSLHAVRFDDDFYRLHQRAFQLTPQQVIVAGRAFYGMHLVAEADFTAHLPETAAAYQALTERAEMLPENACLVRLGWGSGREATTVSYGLANSKSPISRRLTAAGFPLGWAEMHITDLNNQPISATASAKTTAPTPVKKESPVTGRTKQPRAIADLEIGMQLSGQVVGIAKFGAFVDIGVGQDGLIHISKLADRRVARVEDVVKRGDRVRVEVIGIEPERKRISLKLLAMER